MYYGIIIFSVDIAFGAMWVPPACTRFPSPPLAVVIQIHSMVWGAKYQRCGYQQAISRLLRSRRQLLLQFVPIWFFLGSCNVMGSFYKFGKLRIGYFRYIYPKTVHTYLVFWIFIGRRL